MSVTIDFQARIDSIVRILNIGEYTTAATECVKLSEQALRRIVSQYLDQVTEKVRQDVQDAFRKRVRGDGGIEKLTMGQMIYTLRDARFLEDWARLTGKSLSSLQVIDLEKLTQLRNKIMHDGAEATRTEAEFLLHGLKMILETFGLLTFAEPPPPTQAQGIRSSGQHISELPTGLHARIIDFLKSLPNLADENGQRAFIYAAGVDAALQAQIRFSLPLAEFVPFLVATLTNYGELQDGRYALRVVLETAQQYIGLDRQAACESLIQELSDYLKTAPLQGKPTADSARPQPYPDRAAENKETPRVVNKTSNVQFGKVSFGNVGRNVNMVQAGGDLVGDVVAGDNIINQIPGATTPLKYGFKQDADKAKFLQQIEELRTTLREIKTAIEALNELDDDQKDETAMAVMQQAKDLKTVKETAETIVISQEASKEQVGQVRKSLDKTTILMEKLKKMGEATAALEKIIPAIVKALPLLASVRRLFGLP
jgi:hypothetical protein